MTKARSSRAEALRLSAALLVLTAIWLTMLELGRGPLDQRIYAALYAGDRPVLSAIAHFFTTLGEPTVLIAATVALALWLWYAGHHRLPLALIAITMLARGLNELQKYWIARPRPDLEEHLVVVKTMSFPSGHATSSMVFYVIVALTLTQGMRWHRAAVIGALVMTLLVGTSRVMLGVHWPSDVIGGWAFGALWVLLTLRLAERFVKRGDAAAKR